MDKLVLFDIDGTLTKSDGKGTHSKAFEAAIRELHSIEVTVNDKNIQGLTDRLILGMLLSEAGFDESEVKKHIQPLLDSTERHFLKEYKPRDSGGYSLLPGIKKFLKSLSKHDVIIGLLTGNIEAIARAKLVPLGVYKYFSTGGFGGSDPHTTRAELVEFALSKAGFDNDKDRVYLVGDTPRDISAAKEAGLSHTVGVATGHYSMNELKASGAETVLADFTDIKKSLKAFGIAHDTPNLGL